MTEKEAKKIMENEVRCVRNPNCERLECRNCYLVMPEHTVLKAYEVAIKALEQRWIPVSERLPDKNVDCLVTLENGVVTVLGYSTTQRTTYPKGFYYVKDGFSWRQIQNPVIAWMPLPEPYKAESEDKYGNLYSRQQNAYSSTLLHKS